MSALFISSVSDAVSQSMNSGKPMLVVINSDSSSEDSWTSKLISDETVQPLIQNSMIALKLVKPSQDYDFFSQIFPNPPTPSIYIIQSGKLLGAVINEITCDDFKQRLEKVISKSVAPSYTTSNTTTTESISSPAKAAKDETPTKKTEMKSIPEKKQYNSIKEQIAEESAKRYRDQLLKQKRIEREEHERILRLLKADQDERRKLKESKEKEKENSNTTHIIKPEKCTNLPKTHHDGHKYPKCVLSIRLLDGSRITHEFNSLQTLNEVRHWVDKNRSDGDQPYTFYQAIIKKSYEIGEESQPLSELNLPPRSALILKPEENYSNAYAGVQSSWLSKMSNAFYSALGYGNESSQKPQNDENQNIIDENLQKSINDNDNAVLTGDSFPSPMSTPLESASPFIRSNNTSNEDLHSFYSSSSIINGSKTSLPENKRIKSFENNKERKTTYNGNQTNLEDDSNKNKRKED